MKSSNEMPVFLARGLKIGIPAIILIILTLFMVKWVTVAGNEMGVLETWSGGVQPEPLPSRTHWFFPGYTNTVYRYDMGIQVFVMNDNKTDKYIGRDADAFRVASSEGQEMVISSVTQWRINPKKLVELHKFVRDNIEDRLIRPVVMRVIKDSATTKKAIDAYSGEGLVKLQNSIQEALTDEKGELAERGIVVENFLIEHIELDANYIGEIRLRQVATQKKLKAEEETKYAEAQALQAKAMAQADYNKRVVEADRDKKVGILKAEENAEIQVLAAKADAEKVALAAAADAKKVVLAAEAEKDQSLLRAQGVEALGKAEAEALRLKLSAFSVQGSDNYTKVEIAKQMATAFSGIKGYLPADLSVNVLSENFLRSIDGLLNPAKKP